MSLWALLETQEGETETTLLWSEKCSKFLQKALNEFQALKKERKDTTLLTKKRDKRVKERNIDTHPFF